MIIVAVEIVVKDGTVEGIRSALRTMEDATQKEPGCITFVFSVDVNDSTMIRIYERWETIESLAARFKTPHMAPFRKVLKEVQQSMKVDVYEVGKELQLPTEEEFASKEWFDEQDQQKVSI